MASKSSRLLIWFVAFVVLIVGIAVVAALLLAGGETPTIGQDAQWLHLKVDGELREAPGNEGLLTDPGDLPPLSTELAQEIRDAAKDANIAGIFLEIDGVEAGWAQVQEIRDALLAFEAAGKRCVAWSGEYDNRGYYLATACEDLRLAPAGISLINGLALTQTYYAGTFERIGVTANFEHVGDFKSAVEPYQRTGPSEAAAEATNALLDSLYGQLIDGIAAGRKLDADAVRALVDDPPLAPADALKAGLVDALSYRDEAMKDCTEDDMLSARHYLRDRREDWSAGKAEIAVVYAEGTIASGDSDTGVLGGQVIGDRTIGKILTDLREDDDVAAVVLRVSSPGGSGAASDAIWHDIELLKAEKPVVVSMGDYAASGGYYISAGAARIFAEPGTLTGSIGVFGGKLNLSGALDKVGLSTHTAQRGAQATMLSSMSDFDEAGRIRFRSFLQDFYETFLDRTATGRGMTRDEVHAVAQGRVWTGQQALERGLVDELGGLDAAIAAAATLAELDTYGIRRLPERKGFLDQIMEELAGSTVSVDPLLLTPTLREAADRAMLLERVLADGGVAVLAPTPDIR